ncbi:MAG TPA: sulfatase [Longimicrobiales bacterium]|nr:sulfatase [Longimicrobiales bacterium]
MNRILLATSLFATALAGTPAYAQEVAHARAVAGAHATALHEPPANSHHAAQPNIVFLFADDHAAHALSAYREHLSYGAPLPATPNLDRLAASGMLFVNAFVTNSICGPSRATVLTGQYGHLNGVMTNAEPLHPAHVTFPKLLRSAGYRTAMFGKWHLRTAPEGFDHYEVLTGQGPHYNPTLHSPGDSTHYTGATQEVITERALAWLQQRRDNDAPFLLTVNFNASHRFWDPGPEELPLYRDTLLAEPATLWDDGTGRASPFRLQEMEIARDLFARDLKLEAPVNLTPGQRAAWDAYYGPENAGLEAAGLEGEELVRWKYQRFIQDYMRAVAAIDRSVGSILDAIDRSPLRDNTVVVYSSDQGFFLGDHGFFDKRWMYEESLRTPLLVRWPGVVEAGAVNTDLVMNLDFAQTFLDVGGAGADAAMQGRSLVPLLRGDDVAWRDAIYYQYFAYPDWHMVHRQYGVRTHRYKLIHYYEIGEWELFDLARDPQELRSVYDHPEYQAVVRELKQRLTELRAEYDVPTVDPVPHTPFVAPEGLRRPENR